MKRRFGKHITQKDYSQYLLVSQVNFTMTNFAKHVKDLTHDTINRYMSKEKITPANVWEIAKTDILYSKNGKLIFDDFVETKEYSSKIQIVRKQYSGCVGRVVKGIGVVTCIYYNPEIRKSWVVDFRIFDPDCDGKTKIDHVKDIFKTSIYSKQIPFYHVLMDSWYSCVELMTLFSEHDKTYFTPIKTNRLCKEKDGEYKNVKKLSWNEKELENGKLVYFKGFPKDCHVKLFCTVVSTGKVQHIVTNDVTQCSASDVQKSYATRWNIETFHREIKQTSGIGFCQARVQRLQRNHIACSMIVWLALNSTARKLRTSVYALKSMLLTNYLTNELLKPSLTACCA